MSDQQPSFGHVSRPGGITLLMVLGVIQGAMAILLGIVLIIDRDSRSLQLQAHMNSDTLLATGIGVMAGGLIHLALALLLGKGNQIVRWLFGIVTMVNVSFGVWGLLSTHGEHRLSAAYVTVFGILILWILFGSERTDRFFAQDD